MALLQGARSASSSPSSSFSPPWRYQVFLSFRGEDTRNNFTAHLYRALDQKGIKTYIDNNLERGEEISPALLEAIEGSRISIIILSPHYTSSTWCLKELLKILECKETKQQIVLPVFYHVDPSDVQHQRNSFEEAFAEHESRFKYDKEKVQRWKAALTEVRNLSGFHLKKEGNESEFIDEIIQQVEKSIIPHTSLHVAKYPVGIESRVKNICSLLCVEMNDTRMVGIFGIGGIGKTTIAKAIYNLIAHQFEATCFLPNVRETSAGERGLVKLQEMLLSDILGDSNLKVGIVDRGINLIKDRLCRKRILLILDDVDQLKQLEKLAGERDWFGSGSRIIITTRDRNVLTNHDVDFTYEVKRLNWEESLQLFNLSAFKGDNQPIVEYKKLVKQIIDYAGGLPLALQVLGSDLHGKSFREWESAIKDYRESPHQDIQRVLRISYDGLGKNEKNIFLDIACFFKGKNKKYVMKILDNCGFSAEIGIRRLMDKCLITTNKHSNYLEMHDLLQEMGQEIVREESPEEPCGRNRLWLCEDVCMVLEENTGTNKIEAIVVELPEGNDIIRLSPIAFMEMKRLRLFIINDYDDYVCFSGELNSLPNELRVLDWDGYHLPSLPSNFHGKKLSFLKLRGSLIQDVRVVEHMNLTVLDFSFCELLTKIPNLSRHRNLKELNLLFCKNLEEIHDSVGLLDKLVRFDLSGCSKLWSFPRSIKLISLEYLDLEHCSSLLNFPEIEGEMKNLDGITLDGIGITELPSSIINISGLRSLKFKCCENLRHLPGSIFQLQYLESLWIEACPRFRGFGEKQMEDNRQFMASVMPNMEYEISGSPLRNSSISNDDCYKEAAVQASKFLGPKNLVLSQSNCFTNSTWQPNLNELLLSKIGIVNLPSSIINFSRLRCLNLMCCENLTHLPGSIFQLQYLESLWIEACPRFRGFREKQMEDNRQFIASIMPNREYEISGTPPRNSSISNDDCNKEAAVWASEFLGLENLVLSQSNCFANSTWLPNLNELLLLKTGIVNLPASIKRFVRLRLLNLEQCEQLQEIPELPQSIKKVYARGCISLESFPQVSKKFQFDTSDDSLDKLNWLDLSACHKMLKKLRNPVLSPSLHPDLQLGPIYVGEEIPTSRFRLLEDYVLDGIADHRRGFPTWFSRRYGNRCRINVILQECLEEAITITLCAVIVIARPLVELCVSASVIREGRSPRRVEGTTVCIGKENLWDSPHLFLAYTTVEPSELEGNHLQVEFSASLYGTEVEIASCEVHRVHEHKERVEARKRKNENKERVKAQKMKRENKETGREKDDVLQMDVSNAEPENKERARTKDAPGVLRRGSYVQMDVSNTEPETLLDLLSMIQLYQISRESEFLRRANGIWENRTDSSSTPTFYEFF